MPSRVRNEVLEMDEKTFIWPKGVKRTKSREQVISVLKKAEIPLTANAIYKQLQKEEESVWISTIYRVLDTFVEKGVVLKTTVLDNEMALYELNRYRHKHYAICLNCHKMVTMENCPLEKFVPHLAESGFQVLGHKIEMYGYCKNCQLQRKKE